MQIELTAIHQFILRKPVFIVSGGRSRHERLLGNNGPQASSMLPRYRDVPGNQARWKPADRAVSIFQSVATRHVKLLGKILEHARLERWASIKSPIMEACARDERAPCLFLQIFNA